MSTPMVRGTGEAAIGNSQLTDYDPLTSMEVTLTLMGDMNQTTDNLVRIAKACIIGLIPATEEYTVRGLDEDYFRKNYPKAFQTHTILYAFLDHAPNLRYAAAAIVASGQTVEGLNGLADQWMSQLLRPFYTAYKTLDTPMSSNASPTFDNTFMEIDPAGGRQSNFAKKVAEREGFRCIVTHVPDGDTYLEAAHILRYGLAKGNNSTAGISSGAVSTWDIILHFGNLENAFIGNLKERINSPTNGILLDSLMHKAFDAFRWCLLRTEAEHEYTVHWLTAPITLYTILGHETVSFKDSNVLPPDSKLLAVHAGIAKILHATDAGELFNDLIHRFSENPSTTPTLLRTIDNYDDLQLRLSLANLAGDSMRHLPKERRIIGPVY